MSYLPDPFTPEGVNPNSSYLATCINRVNNNYKVADINSSNYNELHYLKSYTGDIAVSDAASTKFNNAISLKDNLNTTNEVLLYNYGKSLFNNSVVGIPGNGNNGSSSTRIILSPGDTNNTPMGFGVNSLFELWYGTRTTGSHIFYTGLSQKLTINNTNIICNNNLICNGNLGIGTTNPISLLHLHNPLSLGEIKLSLTDGSTGIGTSDGFSIIKTSTEEGHIWNYENSPILFGTNNNERMRINNIGNIGIGTNSPNSTLDINGILNVKNSFFNIPTTSFFGSSGDRIILREGSSTIYPYSIGLDTNKLWYSIPSSAEYFFYINGNKTLNITSSSIDISINSTLNMSLNLSQSGGSLLGCSSINEQYSLSALQGDTVLRSKTGNKLILQAGSDYSSFTIFSNNNIGIGSGITNANNILQVGQGGRLRIANNVDDYTIIGTRDIDNNSLNTKILLNGNTATGAGTPGSIQYFATGTGNSHIFYGGITERMRIRSDGNVGIGTNNPGNILQIGDGGRLRIANDENDFTLIGTRNTNSLQNTQIAISGRTRPLFAGNIDLITTSTGNHIFSNEGNIRMLILANGNVGIGTTDPKTLLDVRGKIFTSSGLGATPINGLYGSDGTRLILWPGADNDTGYMLGIAGSTMWYSVPSSAVHAFYTGTNERMRIRNDGNVGIGTNNPGNILQVGNAGRLKIANATNDLTIIGTKDVNDNNNTRIGLSGFERTGNNGNIEYIATTATGKHKFYVNATTTLVNLDSSDCTFYNSITTIGANYYTDGEYLANTSKTNTSGVVKTGYFIYLGYFFNSLLNIAISHNDTTYTYWHGNIGTNNSTAPIYITLLAQNNATIESFQEQTTNDRWIYFRPTSSYNASVQLRVKFYG